VTDRRPSRILRRSAMSEPGTKELRNLLTVNNLTVDFPLKNSTVLRALDGVSLTIAEGEIHGLVGESGSGKTVMAHSIMRLVDRPGRVSQGEIFWQGKDLLTFSERELNEVRGRGIAMIFQNAEASLNPALKINTQLVQLLKFRRNMDSAAAQNEASRLIAAVHLPDSARVLRSYPHELSVGMAQRVAIALVLACKPTLVIADEPTSALDVTAAVQILDLFRELREAFGLSILLISHDLAVIARSCDRVSVLKGGKVVENGNTTDVFHRPKHPYTQLLLKSVLSPILTTRISLPECSAHDTDTQP
jgi:peptide/nickel transport system ATP-binding protein